MGAEDPEKSIKADPVLEIFPQIQQLIERINTMSMAEVDEVLKTLDYGKISVLTTLGEMAKGGAKELESKILRDRNLQQWVVVSVDLIHKWSYS